MKVFRLLFPLIFIVACSEQQSEITLPAIINSGMVLQRDAEVAIWGKANPGTPITVSGSWGVTLKTKSTKDGSWEIKIPTTSAGGPFELSIAAPDTMIILDNILMGEVWLCSGQSNMEMPLKGWPPTDLIFNSEEEIAAADYPAIRLFTVTKKTSTNPISYCEGSWSICTPENIQDFSATAYFFGRELHRELNIPIGLIHSSWGGTPAEAWTPAEYLNTIPAYKAIHDTLVKTSSDYANLQIWMKGLDSLPLDFESMNFIDRIINDSVPFARPEYDDSSWDEAPIPSFWETNVLPNFDGIVWFRKEFEAGPELAGKEAVLNLGAIDDMDVCYINGQKIGKTLGEGFWKQERKYTIPAGILVEGSNVLSVCVIDHMGGGGIYGPNEIIIKGPSGEILNPGENWKYMPVAEIVGSKVFYFTEEKSFTERPKVKYALNQYTPTTLYNAMIFPLIPYGIKGVIWYQGESNVGRGIEYRTLFPTLISSWRANFKQGDFPFYYVQIAPYVYDDEEKSPAAELREAQLLSLSVENTGMVVTTDIGNPDNIHPGNKAEVGRRLALWALAHDYGYDTVVYSGPIFDTLKIEDGKALVEFLYDNGGLVARGGKLSHFEIAGEDQIYYPADALIREGKVEVSSSKVPDPVAVRFGWSAIAEPNLFNGAGLPASPFRSDNWKRLSE